MENLFAFTAVDANYSQGTAGAILWRKGWNSSYFNSS